MNDYEQKLKYMRKYMRKYRKRSRYRHGGRQEAKIRVEKHPNRKEEYSPLFDPSKMEWPKHEDLTASFFHDPPPGYKELTARAPV
jgi:hypothetical protein